MSVPVTYQHFAERTARSKQKLYGAIALLRNTQYDAEDDGYPMTERKVKDLADRMDALLPELEKLEAVFNEAAELAFTTEDEW